MGWNDHIDESRKERDEFLEQLLAERRLSDTATGIAKLVIAKGDAALSEKQQAVYEEHILAGYRGMECRRCFCPIPLNEAVTAKQWNAGYCASCANAASKLN